jgi:hypothetical protein
MANLFSGDKRSDWPKGGVWAPPPPRSPAPREQVVEGPTPARVPSAPAWQEAPVATRPGTNRPAGHVFEAELDIAEIDERGRPDHPWTARARQLSRSNIVIRSRRMCYLGREVVLAVHLIDGAPVALFGRVVLCDYDGEGQYVVDIDLISLPDRPELRDWIAKLAG